MEGILLKWTNVFQRWQQNYFILNNDILTYCEQKNSEAKGQVHLKIAGIILVPDDPLQFIINTGTTELSLKATSLEDKIKWISSLKCAQDNCQQETTISFERKLADILSILWISFANFDELLNHLQNKVNAHTSELIEKIMDTGQTLKAYITQGLSLIQEGKEKIAENTNTIYESFNNNEVEALDYSDLSPSKSLNYRHNGVPIERRVYTEDFTPISSENRERSLQSILQDIRYSQPIKFKNILNNAVLNKIRLSNLKERDSLPFKQDPHEKFNFWPFLKEVIGKDLTRIPVPLIFHQPLSVLQLMVQKFDYYDCLRKATNCEDSQMRMCYLIAFSLSHCAHTIDSNKKPFNPLLGETFEFVGPDYWVVCEQVSHHPPISTMYAEGSDFNLFCYQEPFIKFGGTSLKLVHPTQTHIYLKKYKEHYSFDVPTMLIKNIIFGEKYFEHVGELKYINYATGDVGIVRMTERNWDGTNACNVSAEIRDNKGIVRKIMNGFYNKEIYVGQECIWKRKIPDSNNIWYYGYSQFVLQLNYLNSDNLHSIPSSDSRLRPDIRALENGWKTLGQEEKLRLEEKQRDKRNIMEKNNEEHIPRYFVLGQEQYTKQKIWLYKGNYWDEKQETTTDLY